MLALRDLEVLVGQSVLAISHAPYSASVGVMNLDLVTDGGSVYRFSIEEIDGEHTSGGWAQEHYSLTLERLAVATLDDERSDLVGAITKVELIQSDEWLGPVDHSIEAHGENPRMLFSGKAGSCPQHATCTTVICGVILQCEAWELLVRTHSFPQQLDFTTDPTEIGEFLNQYRGLDEAQASFVCARCGTAHEGYSTDRGYTLPDDVWAIPEAEREKQAMWNTDFCRMGDRHFIRCILRIPFTQRDGYFGWGVWVEVQEGDFLRYLDVYSVDAFDEPPKSGLLANRIPGYEDAAHERVSVQFGSHDDRPDVVTDSRSLSSLAKQQREGIDEARYHAMLVQFGEI